MTTPNVPEGYWRSNGYGWIMRIEPGRSELYHATAYNCLRNTDPYWEGFPSTLYDVKLAPDGSSFTAYTTENVTRFTFERIPNKPELCSAEETGLTDDPEINFEAFWHQFDEHYAFFKERFVDWHAGYQKYRPRVEADTTKRELFEIFAEMLEPLNDRHVALYAGETGFYNSGLDRIGRQVRDAYPALCDGEAFWDCYRSQFTPYKKIVDKGYLNDVYTKTANDQLTWGMLNAEIAYLRVDRFRKFLPEGSYADELGVLEATLDHAFNDLREAKALVLDIRFNTGGYDGLTLHLAGRFTVRETPAFAKYAKSRSGFTEPQAFRTVPTGTRAFTGPIAILTSEATQSASENLILFMQPFENVHVFGERTGMAHSDALYKPLPNGWSVEISNEVFEGPDGLVYEARGIEPDYEVPYFTSEVLESGIDPVLDTAIETLMERLMH